MAKIITVANNKGGVGKSMLTYHYAKRFSRIGNTMVIDLDSQGNVTKYLMRGEPLPDHAHVQNFFTNKKRNVSYIVDKADDTELQLFGSSISLSESENSGDLNKYFTLRKALKKINTDNIKYIIVDTPPNIGLFTLNALLVSDYVVLPVDSSIDSFEALDIMYRTIDDVRNDHNERLQIAGIVPNGFDMRTKADQQQIKRISESYGPDLIKTIIPHSTTMRTARAEYKTIGELDQFNPVAEAIEDSYHDLLIRTTRGL